MTKDDALKLAIEFIHKTQFESGGNYYVNRDKTIQACKEALEQPTNMITIPLDKLEDMQRRLKEQPTKEEILGKVFDAVYAQYPKKEWQGLSYDDISYTWAGFAPEEIEFARAIEAKLKEKNNV